ncbi:unnamed protein product [Musa acuminata subsp. malaccensis]|uniref:(wild Malaysian banana) hypothetical protein n=1 Tax=Musa acuminata subsp. malaccensis TaxID=214687 RepID=A0A8D7AKI0_MUSAM|nr:unnamed protein product [Musa acuminata subsp. malaccensis]
MFLKKMFLTHNQAGIVYNGGLVPLLKLLDSKNGCLQHNAAFAFYGIAENEANISDFIKVGGVQKLQDGEFIIQATKDCVAKTMKRLEEKINGRVLKHLLYLMRVGEKAVQRRIALALAHLQHILNIGLDLLLELLGSTNLKQQQDASVALYKLAKKSLTLCSVDAASSSPSPQVYLGEQYVNSSTLSYVTFVIEGCGLFLPYVVFSFKQLHSTFKNVVTYEKDARDVEIPNIRWEVFESMMRFIYTGSGLKLLCEYAIAQEVCIDNVSSMYELSEAFHAMSLRHTCVMFILEQFEKINSSRAFPSNPANNSRDPQLICWSLSAPNIYFRRGCNLIIFSCAKMNGMFFYLSCLVFLNGGLLVVDTLSSYSSNEFNMMQAFFSLLKSVHIISTRVFGENVFPSMMCVFNILLTIQNFFLAIVKCFKLGILYRFSDN